MKLLCRLFGGLVLLCLACFVLFQGGCGSSSKNNSGGSNANSNSPFTVEGNWNISASGSGGGTLSFSAAVVTQTLQSGNCVVDSPIGSFTIDNATTCFVADPGANLGSISNVQGNWTYPPAGFMFGLSTADPIPANSTSQLTGFFVMANSTSDVILDISGTITASTGSMSGSYSCDSTNPDCGSSGTFTGSQ